MENEDKTTFSLEDSDDEVVEEEVIDRDEEYEDEDEEEEYDDEEYDDEGEDYDDEGYNDDYYDDRLNKVLDEIAELKRGMSNNNTPAVQQPMPPQYVYQPSAPPAGSEVVMYNEISRLRDELAKNQSSLEMQKELSRIKDDMARDQKFAESQYNAEIKRLQDKIDDLLKNASSPQSEQLPPPQAHLEGGKSIDFDKLLSINESILRATRDSDARIQSEIAQLRKQVEEFPSKDEMSRVLSAAKRSGGDGLSSDALNKLSSDISALHAAVQGISGGAAPVASSAPIVIHDGGAGDVSASELLRQLYEIKNVLGSSSAAAVKRTQTMSELINDFKKVNFDVHSHSVSYKDKLVSLFAYAQKLEECGEQDAVDLVKATNSLIEELASVDVDRQVFADISAYGSETGHAVSSAVRDSAEKYFNIVEKLAEVTLDEMGDLLPDLVAEKNALQKNLHEDENNALFMDITDGLVAEKRDDEAIKEAVSTLVSLKAGEVMEFPLIAGPKSYKASRAVNDDTIFAKLAEIKAAVSDASEIISANAAGSAAAADEDVYDQPAVEEAEAAAGISDEVIDELRNNYVDILDKLVEISDKIIAPEEDAPTEVITEEDKEKAIEDFEYIRNKLDDHEVFINQIGDLRADVLNISNSIDLTEQFNSVLSEISNQFDDLANAIIDTETNIINRINELPVINDVVSEVVGDAKAEVLADTQAIRDTLAAINDSITAVSDTVVALPIGDAVEQLRTDVLNLSDQVTLNADAALNDRQKLLDDIAFLREQAELAIAEREQEEQDAMAVDPDEKTPEELESEKLYGYLDDIVAKIELLATLPEDVASAKDNVNTVLDVVTPMSDAVLAINDTANTTLEAVNAATEAATASRDAATAALDALTPISDRINEIIERMDAEAQQAAEAAEAAELENAAAEGEEEQPDPIAEGINEIKEQLSTVLDTLPLLPQNDDLITARDNTYSILDTLTMMPQSEDVVTTRDNVAAILEAVNALTESLHTISEGTVVEDIAIVRDNTNTMLDTLATLAQTQEDVQYIRQKLDETPEAEEPDDTLVNIMNDLGLVLEKLEAFEQTAVDNKQEIVDTVSGIREEIHITELDESISASGIDDETRETLVNEIAEIRERLNNLDTITQTISDANTAALENITAQLSELQAAVTAEGETEATDENVMQTLDVLTVDIADIKARLEGGVPVTNEDGSAAPVMSDENLQAIIDELSVIKEKIDAESEYDMVEEILSLRDDIKAARIVDQNEVSSELESIKNELAAISSGNILDEIRALRDDVAAITGGQVAEGASAPTDDELNLVLNEIVSLRDEVFAFKDEVISANTASEQPDEPTEQAAPGEDINNILDELTDLREAQSALAETIEELKDVISRRTTLAPEATESSSETAPASNELNVVLDEIINLKNDIDSLNVEGIAQQVEELRSVVDGLAAEKPAEEPDSLAEIKEKLESIELNTATVDMSAVAEQLDNITNAINDLKLAGVTESVAQESEVSVQGIDELRADLDDIKAAIAAIVPGNVDDEIASLRAELEAVRAENEALRQMQNDSVAGELAELKEAVHDMALSMTPAQTESGDTSYAALIDEIKALKDQVAASQQAAPAPASLDEDTLQAIRDALAAQSEAAPLAEELIDIRDEIAQLRSLTTVTADAGSAAEIAALRNELADLKASLSSTDNMYGLAEDVTAIKADVQTLKDEPDLGVMNEILALRDEFQALREQIEDVKRIAGETDKQADDTILNEVQSLRDQLFAISMANVNDAASGETNYESYNNIILDELAGLREQVEAGSSDDLKTVADDLVQLKAAIDKREELYDALASRVAKLDNDATNNKILDELASLRTELANQRDADLTTLNFMSEMANLLERQNNYITQNAGAKITDEIASLKAEIASSKAANAAASDTAQTTDADLADSLSDLKQQLNEIAGIVEPEKKPVKKPAAKKSTGKKSTKKSTGKKAPAKKRTKKASTSASQSVTDIPAEDLEDKIDDQAASLEMTAPNTIPTPATKDVADRLAQQVANKLVIEQLVEQLGYGGMSDEQVDEIINELPQELKTTALDAQSERVRKLANQLVLNKLRDRLGDNGDENN